MVPEAGSRYRLVYSLELTYFVSLIEKIKLFDFWFLYLTYESQELL